MWSWAQWNGIYGWNSWEDFLLRYGFAAFLNLFETIEIGENEKLLISNLNFQLGMASELNLGIVWWFTSTNSSIVSHCFADFSLFLGKLKFVTTYEAGNYLVIVKAFSLSRSPARTKKQGEMNGMDSAWLFHMIKVGNNRAEYGNAVDATLESNLRTLFTVSRHHARDVVNGTSRDIWSLWSLKTRL